MGYEMIVGTTLIEAMVPVEEGETIKLFDVQDIVGITHHSLTEGEVLIHFSNGDFYPFLLEYSEIKEIWITVKQYFGMCEFTVDGIRRNKNVSVTARNIWTKKKE